ncbi:MAG: phenylalanine--tRNA ligase subunit beta [Planctomycetes bacterium]|nr:phenylalanine--tRNA ligase subunit beta [Planctomycetota bacterium]
MPHITFPMADLRALAGEASLSLDDLDRLSALVKGELKRRHSTPDEAKVELQDTNRPDTWCVEGIARAIRQRRRGRPDTYPCFAGDAAPAGTIEVDPSVEQVRPFVAGFVARGWTVDEPGLLAFISAQEVLSRNFGRQRKSVAIGIYDAARITWPVRYLAAPLEAKEHAFVPLTPPNPGDARDGAGRPIDAARWGRPWTPAEVLRDHPTGREFAAALQGADRAPLLVDARGEVLSFPPIINSQGLGRVVAGMSELFVEVTGTTLDQVLLAANVLAANLADRGARIEPVRTIYPFDTPRGPEVQAPHPLEDRRSIEVEAAEVRRLLGEPDLAADEVARWLDAFGLEVARQGERLRVTTPAYRVDYLHAVDAIEDFAISRGYDRLAPLMPEEFTVGALAPMTVFADVARERMLGLGYEEAIGNLLTSVEEVRARMNLGEGAEDGFGPLHGGALVRIQNVMNRNYAVVRDWVVPTLLEVERRSTGAVYPHRVFEAGEVAVWDASQNLASRTEQRLAALLVHDRAGFSELQGVLDQLLRSFGLAFGEGYQLVVREHPSFIPGRATAIVARGAELGVLGEVHPEVLTRWGLYSPAVAFEVRLDALREVVGGQ